MTCTIITVDVLYENPTFFDRNIRYIIGFVTVYSVLAFILMIQPECEFCGKKIFNEKVQIHKKTWLSGWPEIVLSIVKKINLFVCIVVKM